MANRTRHQWPTIGDTLRLEMYNYSNNMPADVTVNGVSVYRVNAVIPSELNPLGLVLADGPFQAVRDGVGRYHVLLEIGQQYASGDYKDIWDVTYSDGSSGKRDFHFKVYGERQAAVTYPPILTWTFDIIPKKVRYDSIFRLGARVRPADIQDKGAAANWTDMLNAGNVEIKIIRMRSVYDYIECEDGGDDDVNASLNWTSMQGRGDELYDILIDTTDAGLKMYPGEYRVLFRVSFMDTLWYSTEKIALQITR